MEQQTLAVETRTGTGKSVTRKLRKNGKLPGIIYGLGKSLPITVEPRLVHKILMEEGGRNKIITLQGPDVQGKSALIKAYQIDPLSRVLLHVDLLEIDVTKKIEVTVALNYTGKAIGVAEGGVLNMIERTVRVKCLPTSIPKHIDVDVTNLKIGASIHLDELTFPEGVEKVGQTNSTLVTVVPPTKEEELVAALAPTAEPEVITEKKVEGEAAAPGAEGADKAKEANKGGEKKEEKKK